MNYLYEVHVQKEAFSICHDKLFASFLYLGTFFNCTFPKSMACSCKYQRMFKQIPMSRSLWVTYIVLWSNATGSLAQKMNNVDPLSSYKGAKWIEKEKLRNDSFLCLQLLSKAFKWYFHFLKHQNFFSKMLYLMVMTREAEMDLNTPPV